MDFMTLLGLDEQSREALAALGIPSVLLVLAAGLAASFVLGVLMEKLIKPALDMVWSEATRPALRAWTIRALSVVLGIAIVYPLISTIWGVYLGIACGGFAAAVRAFARVTVESKIGRRLPDESEGAPPPNTGG